MDNEGDREQAELRAGDRDRRAVDERLQRAMADGFLTLTEYEERSARCWAARTRRDLALLTSDLPDPGDDTSTETTDGSSPVEQAPTTRKNSKPTVGARIANGLWSVGAVAAALFLGAQVLTSADGAAIFSSRTVQIAPDQDNRVQVGALFGKVEVVVPDGVRARTEGLMVFGSVDCNQACQGTPGDREVVIEGRGGFASVQVVTHEEQINGGIDDEDDD